MQNESLSGRTRAYNYIRDEVLPNPSAHGSFITEDEIAGRIGGLSRTPVREAFLLLGAEGFIDLVPRHGAYIKPVTRQEIDEALELRAVIEQRAVQIIMGNHRVPLAALKELLAQQAAVTGEGSEREFNERDTEFHMTLVRAAGNSLMSKVYADLRTRQIRIGVLLIVASPDRRKKVIAEHQAIVDALESGDVDEAIAAVLKHIEHTGAGLREI